MSKIEEISKQTKNLNGFMLPAEISLTEAYVPGKTVYKVHGYALHAITTRHPNEPPRFYELVIDELKSAAPSLIGKGFDIDHNEQRLNPTVNRITVSYWNDQEKRLEYEGEVDRFLARWINQRKPVSIKIDWVIPGGMLKAVEFNGEMGIIPLHFEYGGLSIVDADRPGDPNAFIALMEGIDQKMDIKIVDTTIPVPNFDLRDYLEWQLLQQRKIFFTEDVTEYSARPLCAKLEYLAASSKEPITLILNSPGGSVYDGLLIYNTIKRLVTSGIEVTCEVRGMAASMGAIILQAASKRVASSDTRFLIHEVSSFTWGTTAQLVEEAEEVKKLNDLLNGILSKKTGKTLAELTALEEKTDVWFSAQEALSFGLIDEILKEDNLTVSLLEAISRSREQNVIGEKTMSEKIVETKVSKKLEEVTAPTIASILKPIITSTETPPPVVPVVIMVESPELIAARKELVDAKALIETVQKTSKDSVDEARLERELLVRALETKIPSITVLGCWGHGPRRFIEEIQQVLYAEKQKLSIS